MSVPTKTLQEELPVKVFLFGIGFWTPVLFLNYADLMSDSTKAL